MKTAERSYANTRTANRKDVMPDGGWHYRMLWDRDGHLFFAERVFPRVDVLYLPRWVIARVLRDLRKQRH